MPADRSLSLSPSPASAAEAVRRRFAAAVQASVAPHVARWTAAERLPVGEILAALAAAGCLGAGFPEQFGGDGGDLWHSVVLHEEIARLRSSAVATAVLSHLEVGTRLVLDHATAAHVERWVPPALRGEAVLGYAATEEAAGSDLASTTTSARRDGDHWVLDGRKRFITNGADADALCVLARTGNRGVTSHTLLVVPMRSEGVTTVPLASFGNRGTLAEVRFDGARTEADAVLGLEGQGLLLQIRRLAHERAFVAVMLAAMADAAIDDVVARGRGGSDSTALPVAELAARLEEARALAYHAVATVAAGHDARTPAAMAKLAAARVFRDVTAFALEQCGHRGDPTTRDAYCDALGFAFAGGTDHMLLETVAR